MQFNKLNIEVRPRHAWEALELGSSLLRYYMAAVYKPWLILWFLLASFIFVLPMSIGWKFFFLSWLAPLCERSVVFVLSRAVFGNTPSMKESLKSFLSQCKTGWFSTLVLWRLAPGRAFKSPIWQLEGSKGDFANKRYKALSFMSSTSAFWFGFFFSTIETCVIFTLDYLWFEQSIIQVVTEFSVLQSEIPLQRLAFLYWTMALVYAFFRPFYVSSCFTLYLSQRMKIEGWDIELQFRNIANRVQAKNIILALVFTLTLFTPSLVKAEQTPQEVIGEVMAHEDFNEKQEVTRYFPKDLGEDENVGTPSSPSSQFFTYIIVIICIVAVIGILVYILRNARKLSVRSYKEVVKEVNSVMGMDISKQSLPNDIPGEVMKLWHSGEVRGALSLLYRGALFQFIDVYKVDFEESDTEGDCLLKVNRQSDQREKEFFQELTSLWQQLAYAHVEPQEERIVFLCQHWPQIFNKETSL